MTMTAPRPQFRQPKQLDAEELQPEISSFRLRLAAEGKAAKTIRTYTEAVQWFAAASLLRPGRTAWEQVDSRDVQQWMAWLLDRYSSAYASNQYRALQQFFKWLAAEEELPNPMAGLQPPPVPAAARPGLHRPGTARAGAGLRRPELHPAPRHRDHRGLHRDRHPPVRAGRHPLPPRRPPAQRHRPVAAGDHRPRQGPQGPHRQDRPPGRPQPRPLPPRPRPPPAAAARNCGSAPATASP